jgi:hypothetical protein
MEGGKNENNTNSFPDSEQREGLECLYHSTNDARLRTHAQIVLLATEKGWTSWRA